MELTKRELQIISEVANGLTAGEIGQKLQISKRTVELHYTLIKAKMGAKSLPHLVQLANRQKLIS